MLRRVSLLDLRVRSLAGLGLRPWALVRRSSRSGLLLWPLLPRLGLLPAEGCLLCLPPPLLPSLLLPELLLLLLSLPLLLLESLLLLEVLLVLPLAAGEALS